jgi:hypothetical protein
MFPSSRDKKLKTNPRMNRIAPANEAHPWPSILKK